MDARQSPTALNPWIWERNVCAGVACLVSVCLFSAAHARQALFEELGGEPVIRSVIESLVHDIQEDENLMVLFEFTNFEVFSELLYEHLCTVTDGPCEYAGRTMTEVHLGLYITEAEFNHFVDDLQRIMDLHGIPFRTQNRLLARLAPMRDEIIYR